MPSAFYFNPHAIPVFLSAGAALLLGLIQRLRRPGYPPTTHFMVLCLGIFVWLFCTGMGFIISTPAAALRWFRYDNAGVMFISPSFFAFSVSLVGLKKPRLVCAGYVIAVIFAVLAIVGGFPAVAVKQFPWGFFPQWAILRSIPFFTFFFGFMSAAFFVLRGAAQNEGDYRLRTQVRYVLFAFGVAYLGSVDYLATFGFNFYPFGYIPIMGLVAIIFYAIVQHRLMNIDLLLRDTTVHAVSAAVVGVLAFVTAFPIGTWSTYGGLAAGVVAAILLMMFAYQPIRRALQPSIDRIVFSDRFGYLEELAQLPNDLLEFTNLREMLRFLTTRLTDAGRLQSVRVMMYDPGQQSYLETLINHDAESHSEERATEISPSSSLIQMLQEESRLWTLEEMQIQAFSGASADLRALGCVACFPVKRGDDLIGLVLLGAKKSGEPFNERDLRVLRALRIRLENFLTQAMTITQEALNMVKDSHDMKNDVNVLQARVTWRGMRREDWWAQFQGHLQTAQEAARRVPEPEQVVFLTALDSIKNAGLNWYQDSKRSAPVEEETLKRLGHRLKNWAEYGRVVSEGFQGRRRQERIDVQKVAQFSVERWRPMADKKGLALKMDVESGLEVLGEGTLVEQILENLIDNGIKATASGEVCIIGRREGLSILLSVHDTGDGIPQEDLSRMFSRPFYQGQGRESLEQSTGVGLYLVGQYTRSLGGSVSVESSVGKGSTFYVRLPQALSRVEASQE